MEHEDNSSHLDEERFVNILASSPSASSSPEENGVPRSRSLALRARRNNFILPMLSTSPSASSPSPAETSSSSSASSSSPSASPAIVNNVPEATPPHACTVSPPIPIPSSSSSSKNKPRDLPDPSSFPSPPSSPSPSPSSSSPSSSSKKTLTASEFEVLHNNNNIDISDFECSLCFRVFHQPVTTVCGHVFCKQCLFSALKYSLQCPLCRQRLESVNVKYSVNVLLVSMIEKYFPREFRERGEEERQWSKQNEVTPKEPEEEAIVARPASPSWSCILPSLRSTCTVILSCGGF